MFLRFLGIVGLIVILIMKILLSGEKQTKLCIYFEIKVKVIVLMITIMILKLGGDETCGSKKTNFLP
jgi:hypothetical protein